MFKKDSAHSSPISSKRGDRFAGTWMPSSLGRKKGGNRKSAAAGPQRRWRIKRVSQRALLWLFLPILLLSVGRLGYTMLLHSDIFRVTSVVVKGNQVMNQRQVMNRAGIRPGINLLSMDAEKFEAAITREQWVKKVWIRRHWPSTVEIVISEYKPFALISLTENGGNQLYYVDNDGTVFAPSTSQRDLDYPVINGTLPADELLGKKLAGDTPGGMALEFLKLTDRGNQILPTQAVSEIKIDHEEGLIVYLVDYPFPIYMGKEKIRLRFSRLVKVLARLYKDDRIKGVAEIRMNYAENKILVSRVGEA